MKMREDRTGEEGRRAERSREEKSREERRGAKRSRRSKHPDTHLHLTNSPPDLTYPSPPPATPSAAPPADNRVGI